MDPIIEAFLKALRGFRQNQPTTARDATFVAAPEVKDAPGVPQKIPIGSFRRDRRTAPIRAMARPLAKFAENPIGRALAFGASNFGLGDLSPAKAITPLGRIPFNKGQGFFSLRPERLIDQIPVEMLQRQETLERSFGALGGRLKSVSKGARKEAGVLNESVDRSSRQAFDDIAGDAEELSELLETPIGRALFLDVARRRRLGTIFRPEVATDVIGPIRASVIDELIKVSR